MQVSVKIKGDDRPRVKVGDKVQFNIGEEVYTDTVRYVNGNKIEGEKYDLTYVRINVIDQ